MSNRAVPIMGHDLMVRLDRQVYAQLRGIAKSWGLSASDVAAELVSDNVKLLVAAREISAAMVGIGYQLGRKESDDRS